MPVEPAPPPDDKCRAVVSLVKSSSVVSTVEIKGRVYGVTAQPTLPLDGGIDLVLTLPPELRENGDAADGVYPFKIGMLMGRNKENPHVEAVKEWLTRKMQTETVDFGARAARFCSARFTRRGETVNGCGKLVSLAWAELGPAAG